MAINYLRLETAKLAGAYVKECRLAAGYSQRELELKSGFPSGFIGKLERGEIKKIAIPDIYELQSNLKKFKRAGFEVAGKTELEITSEKSFQNGDTLRRDVTKSPKKPESPDSERWTISRLFDASWPVVVAMAILFTLANWLSGSDGSGNYVPSPATTIE